MICNTALPLFVLLSAGIDYKKGTVHLELKKIGGNYDGKMSEDGPEITGDWSQGGQSLPLAFKRLEKASELKPVAGAEETIPVPRAGS